MIFYAISSQKVRTSHALNQEYGNSVIDTVDIKVWYKYQIVWWANDGHTINKINISFPS